MEEVTRATRPWKLFPNFQYIPTHFNVCFLLSLVQFPHFFSPKSIGHTFWANQKNPPCRGEIMKHLKLTKKQIATLNYPHWELLVFEVATKNHQFITCHHEIQGYFWAGLAFKKESCHVKTPIQLQSIWATTTTPWYDMNHEILIGSWQDPYSGLLWSFRAVKSPVHSK